MPLIDVTYGGSVDQEVLRHLGELLPAVVGEAVECAEEPVTGPVQPGDIEIRFRKKSPLDVGELDVVIEVRTKLFGSRVAVLYLFPVLAVRVSWSVRWSNSGRQRR